MISMGKVFVCIMQDGGILYHLQNNFIYPIK